MVGGRNWCEVSEKNLRDLSSDGVELALGEHPLGDQTVTQAGIAVFAQ